MLPVGSALAIEYYSGLSFVGQTDTERPELSASFDFVASDRWGPGRWTLYLEASSTPPAMGVTARYPQANADAGSALNDEDDARLQISELHYQLPLGRGWLVTGGLMDSSAFLDRSLISNDETRQFLGATLVNNPTINFPDYTLGFALGRPLTEFSQATPSAWGAALVLSSSDGLADNPARSYGELLRSSRGEGLFAAAEFRYRWHRSILRTGVWTNTREVDAVAPGQPSGNGLGSYVSASQQLGDECAVDLRAGLADQRVARAPRFLSAAVAAGPQAGRYGLGWSRNWPAPAVGAERAASTQIELYYRWQPNHYAVQITPSLQHIDNPDFVQARSARILSLRLQLDFQ